MIRTHARSAFSLLELSIVLTLIALIAGSGMMMGQGALDSANVVATNNKLAAIDAALVAYRMGNNRLPCPANVTLTPASAGYGVELATPGTCTGANASYTLPTSSNTAIASGSNVVEGAVPVRALNLPDSYMVDGWGRKIAYAVWAPATATRAFDTYKITPSCGGISIKTASANTTKRSAIAEYALLSYGADGHGGYNSAGSRVSAASTNTDALTNCHCDSAAAAGAYTATYIQKDATQSPTSATDLFDDLVTYREHWTIPGSAETYSPYGAQCAPGFVITGTLSNGRVGYSLAVGDINGDGMADIITAEYRYDSFTGRAFVVFGTRNGFPNPLPLSSLDGTNGFVLYGAIPGGYLGNNVASADINGDGISDIIIASYDTTISGRTHAGSVYVIFGKSGAWPASQTVDTGTGNLIDGTKGFRIDGPGGSTANYIAFGTTLATGDINKDGYADLIVGGDVPGTSRFGAVYVIFGKSGAWPATQDAATGAGNLIDGTKGFRLTGAVSWDALGQLGVKACDINGDGYGDIIASAPGTTIYYPGGQGSIYVVFGKAGSWSSTQDVTSGSGTLIDGTKGFRLDAITAASGSWVYKIGCGDINGDGKEDLIMAATQATVGSDAYTGSVYVLMGKSGSWSATSTFATGSGTLFDGTQGFLLNGELAYDQFGGGGITSYDLNNDGKKDILIGKYSRPTGRPSAGVIYTIFGKSGSWPVNTAVSTSTLIDGIQGFAVDGAHNSDSAYNPLVADIDGDGYKDLIIGAPFYSTNLPASAGAINVYFGKAPSSPWPNIDLYTIAP